MKNRVSKRIIAVFLCLLMLLGNFMISTSAADTEYTYGYYTYSVSGGNAMIVAYSETAKGNVNIPEKIGGYTVTAIDEYAFFGCTLIESVVVPSTVKTIGKHAFAYCTTLASVTIPASVISIGEKVFNNSNNVLLYCEEDSCADTYAQTYGIEVEYIASNIYNLGEETYSFKNFSDYHSNGHCFGMSMTSAGYYLDELDVSIVGITSTKSVNTLGFTTTVKEPICYYQEIQGSYSDNAIVAGGSRYLSNVWDIKSDWNSVINYVKDHSYDNKGQLQIGFRKNGEGGHAINFLYYAVVGGQQRIYAYDNNFPNEETYFYKSGDGKIYQTPHQTFSGSIDCIALRSVEKYYSYVGEYDRTKNIYADDNVINVIGAEKHYMDCTTGEKDRVVFEVPDGYDKVVIEPLVNNATFEYLEKEYSFDSVEDGTVALFTLAENESSKPDFEITKSKVTSVELYDTTMLYKSDFDLTCYVFSVGDVDFTMKFTSSNPNVATVDDDGNVYGTGTGTTTITCTITDEFGNEISDTCNVTVKLAWWQWIIKVVLFGWVWY